jgi:hypothetical protein
MTSYVPLKPDFLADKQRSGIINKKIASVNELVLADRFDLPLRTKNDFHFHRKTSIVFCSKGVSS